MAILPESPALSRASSDDAKVVPDTDILEKGVDADRAPSKPPVWKRIIAGGASDGNETKRAMQSRHLTMIGEHISPLSCLVPRSGLTFLRSYRRNDWHRHLP